MPEVLKVPKQTVALEKGSWVRVKRGLYKGDLAQVSLLISCFIFVIFSIFLTLILIFRFTKLMKTEFG
jgi:hypothetical protein